MFRAIRKKKNEIGTEAAEQLLLESRRGVLAVNGVEGYPYAIPINFYFDKENRKIYFHGAKAGHKIEALRACDKVCFTVYGNETIKEEAWAPFVQSAVVFGRCCLVENDPELVENAPEEVKKALENYCKLAKEQYDFAMSLM